MGKIQVLPEVLAHKIAAGEIVERPASVVKELLENALDARCHQIVVKVENGGRRLISVRDDGVGMSPEDARLAFQHHATSKITTFEDLSRITTLGFRGEALPSIASVCRLRLRTVERDTAEAGAPLGTQIEYEGGVLKEVRDTSWPGGTELVVEDLFFNVPARRKFLKTATTELKHISRQVMHYALAYPHVEFRFIHQKRPLLEAPAVESLKERAYQVLGESFLDHLVHLEYEKDSVRVYGFTSLPYEQRSRANAQFLYVNRRMVRDRVMTHAIRLAYRDLIPSSTHPVILLFLEIDPEQVDVNVHPSKTEIRFRDSSTVHSAIYHGIEEALLRSKVSLGSLAHDIPLPTPDSAKETLGPAQGLVHSLENYFQGQPPRSFGFPTFRKGNGLAVPDSESGLTIPLDPLPSQGAHQDDIPETAHLSPIPTVLGQFVESFVVAADRERVMLIDQHIAHERILFDQALQIMKSPESYPTQGLLVPLTLDLNVQQKVVLNEILDELNANGFEVDWFGTQTIVIKGIPTVAGKCNPQKLLEEILSSMDSELARSESPLERLHEKVAISLSCHAAIKINTPLSKDKMQWLIDQLFHCETPYTCPHGRPIVLRLNIEEILRGFKRI